MEKFFGWLFTCEHIFTLATVLLSGLISWWISAAYFKKGNRNALRLNVLFPMRRIISEQRSWKNYKILEDTSKGIKKALAADAEFAEKFTERISVPIFTNDELVSFALSYSSELGYKIDEMAILALHNRISNIERLDQATTLTEVKEIVDEAIDREAHGGLKKAISILTAKRYTEDDKIVLTENYFEQK